jgi:hypothetical protein
VGIYRRDQESFFSLLFSFEVGLYIRNLFPLILEAGKSKIKVLADLASAGGRLPIQVNDN